MQCSYYAGITSHCLQCSYYAGITSHCLRAATHLLGDGKGNYWHLCCRHMAWQSGAGGCWHPNEKVVRIV